jgi:hypothetical protein
VIGDPRRLLSHGRATAAASAHTTETHWRTPRMHKPGPVAKFPGAMAREAQGGHDGGVLTSCGSTQGSAHAHHRSAARGWRPASHSRLSGMYSVQARSCSGSTRTGKVPRPDTRVLTTVNRVSHRQQPHWIPALSSQWSVAVAEEKEKAVDVGRGKGYVFYTPRWPKLPPEQLDRSNGSARFLASRQQIPATREIHGSVELVSGGETSVHSTSDTRSRREYGVRRGLEAPCLGHNHIAMNSPESRAVEWVCWRDWHGVGERDDESVPHGSGSSLVCLDAAGALVTRAHRSVKRWRHPRVRVTSSVPASGSHTANVTHATWADRGMRGSGPAKGENSPCTGFLYLFLFHFSFAILSKFQTLVFLIQICWWISHTN